MGWVHALSAAAAAVLVAGCELVFPLAPTDRADAAGDGAPIPDGVPPPPDAVPPCPGSTAVVTIPAEADASIAATSPDTPLGSNTAINVGVAVQSRGLYRFAIPDEVTTVPIELRLVLRYAENQDDCAASCGSCAPIDAAGTLRAHAASSGWTEGGVTWNQREVGEVWDVPGADGTGAPGDADRSAIGTSAMHQHAQDTTFVLAGGAVVDAWAWRSPPLATRLLTFLVIPTEPAVMVTTSLEGVLTACEPDDVPAALTVVYCQ
jgi:hypothetical protein